MTAYAMKGDREKCPEAGMNDYLAKPVKPKEVAKVLERWLAKKGEEKTMGPQTGPGHPEGALQKEETRAVFNEEELLERLMGDKDLTRLILTGFMEDIPKHIGRLREQLEEGRAPEVRQLAHTIKGAAANVAAGNLRDVAFEMEQAGEEGRLEEARIMFGRLEREFQRLKSILEQTGGV
jgi:two-component system, sensor histidine kinase and response regulator